MDNTLAGVRTGLDVYTQRVAGLERVHSDIMAHMLKSANQQTFLVHLVEGLNRELDGTKGRTTDKDAEIARLTARVQQAEAQLATAQAEISRLSGQLVQAEQEVVRARQQTANLTAQLNQAQLERNTAQEEIGNITTTIQQRSVPQQQYVASLRQDLDAANAKLATLENSMRTQESNLNVLKRKRDEEMTEVQAKLARRGDAIIDREALARDEAELQTLLSAVKTLPPPEVANVAPRLGPRQTQGMDTSNILNQGRR